MQMPPDSYNFTPPSDTHRQEYPHDPPSLNATVAPTFSSHAGREADASNFGISRASQAGICGQGDYDQTQINICNQEQGTFLPAGEIAFTRTFLRFILLGTEPTNEQISFMISKAKAAVKNDF